MATKMDQKRMPFGSVDGNARVSEKRSLGDDDVRKSKSKSGAKVVVSSKSLHATKMTQGIRGTNPSNQQFDGKTVEQRRDSKTPKMSNLSAIGGAYNVENLNDLCMPRGEGGRGGNKRELSKNASQHGLDPSPLKLPDPIASSSSNKSHRSTRQRLHGQSQLEPRDDDGANRLLSDSLKRLFPFPSKTISKEEQTAKARISSRLSPAKFAHFVNNSSTKNLHPIAKGEVEATSGNDTSELLNKRQGTSQRNLQQIVSTSFGIQPPKNGRTQPIRVQQERDQSATADLNELLDKVRSGPPDNKLVLDAMLTSGCGRRTVGPDPTVNEASMLESFTIGSIIGGPLLKRSNSADESEITTIDYTLDSSQASMTTCFDHGMTGWSGIVAPHQTVSDIMPSIDRKQIKDAMPSFFRTSVPTLQPPSSYQEMSDPRQPNEQKTRLVTHPYLPGGWTERWSNTKQKPYWVHPDFGSTWHCPGLIVNDRYETSRNEVVLNTNTSFQTNQMNSSYEQSGIMSRSTFPAVSCITKARLDGDSVIHSSHDAHRIEAFTEDCPRTCGAHECEAYSARIRQSSSEQVSGWSNIGTIMDNDFSQNPTDGRTNSAAKCLDGSSGDVSSRCLTQEFETKREGSTVDDSTPEAVIDDGNDEVEYGHDYASLGEANGDDVGVDAKLDSADHDDFEGQTLGTVADEQSELSSEEDIEVNAVVKHVRSKYASPLSTINEMHRKSEFHRGSACQSSEVSLDDESSTNDDIDESKVKQNFSPKPLSEDSVARGGGDDRSAIDDVVGNISFDNAEMSPDNWESSVQGGFDSDDYDLDVEPMKKNKKTSSPRRGKKKSFFPPGPLCSLQFLEEIENKAFDTPLWRRMKRKRSTLSSVKAQKSKQRQKQRRNTLS